jgi:hypothetical protein
MRYIVRGKGEWKSAGVNSNWFPDASMGTMGSLQAYVEGSSPLLPTGVEDAIGTMRAVEAAYVSSERGVKLPEVERKAGL